MKKMVFFAISCCIYLCCFCQSKEDSILLANSEKWKIQQHKGLFGLSKPAFGAFTTFAVTRFDSTTTKKKTKDSTYTGAEISREGTAIDQSKFLTVEKTKFYRLQLATNTDTAEAVFSISSVSKEKKQTFLGKMLSKNDEGKDLVLSYNRDVSGVIKPQRDSMSWEFFIGNFTSGGRQTATSAYPLASISGGYLRSDEDSLYLETYSSFSADLILVNKKGEHVAAIEFKQKPFNAWIRSDIKNSGQKAIALLFAVIMAIKDF